ncbi:hypothetical protein D3C85_1865820 [compost metagenome]
MYTFDVTVIPILVEAPVRVTGTDDAPLATSVPPTRTVEPLALLAVGFTVSVLTE